MTTQAGNWVAESCSTLGTGDIILTGAATGQAGFSGAISAGAVFYSIEDGNSREAGIGTFDGASTIVRGDIRATLVNGNYTKVSPLPISLTGSSVVSCTYNASAYEDVVQSADAAAASAVAAAASAAAALVSENAAAADLVLTNADAASTAADALSTAADVVLTTADSVATALDVLATSADLVLTNADVVLTNADVASTNADVVLTTADVVSSAASAAAALVSENAAAASAATIPTYDPLTGEALNFVRLNAGETTMEFRTPAEVLSDVGAEAADATILKDADIGVTVQGYDADIPVVVASQAEMEAGTVTANRTMNPAGVKQAIDALASGPAAAISTAFTITSGGLTTWAHGLGARPTKLSGYIKCLTAEDNWSIGDEVEVSIHNNTTTGANRHSSVYTDATNVNMRMSSSASVFSIANKTSGTTSGIVNSRWELYIRAEL